MTKGAKSKNNRNTNRRSDGSQTKAATGLTAFKPGPVPMAVNVPYLRITLEKELNGFTKAGYTKKNCSDWFDLVEGKAETKYTLMSVKSVSVWTDQYITPDTRASATTDLPWVRLAMVFPERFQNYSLGFDGAGKATGLNVTDVVSNSVYGEGTSVSERVGAGFKCNDHVFTYKKSDALLKIQSSTARCLVRVTAEFW